MAVELLGINRSDECSNCGECEGGLARFAVSDFCCIQDIVIDQATRCVTGVVYNTTGVTNWAEYVHEDDDTSFYSQIQDENGNYNLTGFMKFECIDKEVENEACRLDDICRPVLAVEKNNGETKLVGIDIVKDDAGLYTWKKAKQKVQILNSILTGTGAEKCRLEINITGQQRKPSATFTGIDIDDLTA